LIKYPSIDQFRNVVKAVNFRTNYDGKDEATGKAKFVPRTQPTLKFRGTTKIHGTNASIVIRNIDNAPVVTYQSRERELTLEQDNAGFMLYMSSQMPSIARLASHIRYVYELDITVSPLTIYGEWAGGNIQKGVAISGLEKFFAIFGIRVGEGDETRWLDIEKLGNLHENVLLQSPSTRFYNILDFGKWETEINFERPLEIQNYLGELTLAVEKECPVGKFFGNSGVGEGIVWRCIEKGWESSDYQFKVKGDEHSASKVKKLATVDVEAVRAISDFVDMAVTEARLTQGAQNLVREQGLEFEMANMGPFIKWVYADVMKEEMDTIVANQLDPKKLGGPVANKARAWFVQKFNEGVDFSA
jgi:hypothetical protein